MNKLDSRPSSRLLIFLASVSAAVYLVGCTSAKTLPPTIATPSASATQLSAQTQPTVTDMPSPTVTPASVMGTHLPASTPLPRALTEEEALAFVVNMQETNGGCELPCWWGITPEETTGQTAKQILSPLRELMEFFIGYLGGSEARYEFQLEGYNNIRTELIMKDEEQSIGEIWVFSFIPDEDESTRYHESWRRYFLNELLGRLGMPSAVWLGFGPHTGDHDERPRESIPYYYELYIFYSDLGLVVRYAGPAVRGDVNRACPSLEQLKDMLIFIRRRSRGTLVGPPWEPFTEARPLSEVSNLSLEKFYKAFKTSNGQICLESPANLWP